MRQVSMFDYSKIMLMKEFRGLLNFLTAFITKFSNTYVPFKTERTHNTFPNTFFIFFNCLNDIFEGVTIILLRNQVF